MKKLLNPFRNINNNLHKRSLNSLFKKLPHFNGFSLFDVGAAGNIEPRWCQIEDSIIYTGFEPDKRSRELLMKNKNSCLKYSLIPYALWEVGCDLTLNLCKKLQNSSVYTPNFDLINKYPDPDRYQIDKTVVVPAIKLDDNDSIDCDFMKIDVQGAELNVLKGGGKFLNKVLGLEVEVEFMEIYKDQALFCEVNNYLVAAGFEFMDFITLVRWSNSPDLGAGQLSFGDALFLRAPEFVVKNCSTSKISSYLLICCLYHQYDILYKAISLMPDNIRNDYSSFLVSVKKHILRHKLAWFFSRVINFVYYIFGGQYRSHLLR